jgi:peptide/nickel transport system ATP-binding protein
MPGGSASRKPRPWSRRTRGPGPAVDDGLSPAHQGTILEVSDLSVEYVMDEGSVVAVDHVGFQLGSGEFLAIVGESGCGKSTLLFGIAQLLFPPAQIIGGSVIFQGRNMVGLTDSDLAAVRWKDLSVVMQSAMNALNPVKSIGAQFKDALQAHGVTSKEEIADRSAQVLRMVGIDPVHLKSYPHAVGRHAPALDDRNGDAVHARACDHGRAHVRA